MSKKDKPTINKSPSKESSPQSISQPMVGDKCADASRAFYKHQVRERIHGESRRIICGG